MRRFLFILPLLCLVAHADEIKGWKVVKGEWAKEKSITINGTGILQWDGSAEREIQISFLVKVKKWTHHDAGRGSVGFIWNANDMTSSDSQDPPRNWAAILRPGRVVVFSQPARPEPKTDIAYDMPMNRFVPVKAKITKSGIQMQVGRQTVAAELPCENLVHLQLVANYGHFEFYKLKVKGK